MKSLESSQAAEKEALPRCVVSARTAQNRATQVLRAVSEYLNNASDSESRKADLILRYNEANRRVGEATGVSGLKELVRNPNSYSPRDGVRDYGEKLRRRKSNPMAAASGQNLAIIWTLGFGIMFVAPHLASMRTGLGSGPGS